MNVTEQSEVAQRSMIPELAVWTFATGLVDAVTYLKLGHVFTANMTGNVVLSGFVVGGEESILILNVLAAVVGFAVGAFFCGRVLIPRFQAYRLIRLSLATQIVISPLALVVAFFAPGAMKTIAFALGASMGVQNAAARKIAVPDFTTTVLTMTVTGLFADKTS